MTKRLRSQPVPPPPQAPLCVTAARDCFWLGLRSVHHPTHGVVSFTMWGSCSTAFVGTWVSAVCRWAEPGSAGAPTVWIRGDTVQPCASEPSLPCPWSERARTAFRAPKGRLDASSCVVSLHAMQQYLRSQPRGRTSVRARVAAKSALMRAEGNVRFFLLALRSEPRSTDTGCVGSVGVIECTFMVYGAAAWLWPFIQLGACYVFTRVKVARDEEERPCASAPSIPPLLASTWITGVKPSNWHRLSLPFLCEPSTVTPRTDPIDSQALDIGDPSSSPTGAPSTCAGNASPRSGPGVGKAISPPCIAWDAAARVYGRSTVCVEGVVTDCLGHGAYVLHNHTLVLLTQYADVRIFDLLCVGVHIRCSDVHVLPLRCASWSLQLAACARSCVRLLKWAPGSSPGHRLHRHTTVPSSVFARVASPASAAWLWHARCCLRLCKPRPRLSALLRQIWCLVAPPPHPEPVPPPSSLTPPETQGSAWGSMFGPIASAFAEHHGCNVDPPCSLPTLLCSSHVLQCARAVSSADPAWDARRLLTADCDPGMSHNHSTDPTGSTGTASRHVLVVGALRSCEHSRWAWLVPEGIPVHVPLRRVQDPEADGPPAWTRCQHGYARMVALRNPTLLCGQARSDVALVLHGGWNDCIAMDDSPMPFVGRVGCLTCATAGERETLDSDEAFGEECDHGSKPCFPPEVAHDPVPPLNERMPPYATLAMALYGAVDSDTPFVARVTHVLHHGSLLRLRMEDPSMARAWSCVTVEVDARCFVLPVIACTPPLTVGDDTPAGETQVACGQWYAFRGFGLHTREVDAGSRCVSYRVLQPRIASFSVAEPLSSPMRARTRYGVHVASHDLVREAFAWQERVFRELQDEIPLCAVRMQPCVSLVNASITYVRRVVFGLRCTLCAADAAESRRADARIRPNDANVEVPYGTGVDDHNVDVDHSRVEDGSVCMALLAHHEHHRVRVAALLVVEDGSSAVQLRVMHMDHMELLMPAGSERRLASWLAETGNGSHFRMGWDGEWFVESPSSSHGVPHHALSWLQDVFRGSLMRQQVMCLVGLRHGEANCNQGEDSEWVAKEMKLGGGVTFRTFVRTSSVTLDCLDLRLVDPGERATQLLRALSATVSIE